MNQIWMAGGPGGRRPLRRMRWPGAGLAAVIALLAAACGGGSSAGGSGGSPATGDPASSSAAGRPAAQQKQLAYSQCMRSHGVPDVPTFLPSLPSGAPSRKGPHKAARVSGPDPNSPQFQAAEQACQSLQPANNRPAG